MLGNGVTLPGGLFLRPVREGDAAFLATLYHGTRDDLRLLANRDLTESLIEQQQQAQQQGYGEAFPDAMHFIIGLHQDAIGRLIVDFSRGTVHVVNIALIPTARGQGYGGAVIRAMQMAAEKIHAPVTLSVHHGNDAAWQLYRQLGFAVQEHYESHALLCWAPPALMRAGARP